MTDANNDLQREQSASRLQKIALDELGRVLEQVGIDIKTSDGRRSLRQQLDYLAELYEGQDARRTTLDWTRKIMALNPDPETIFRWAAAKMRAEDATREAVRKTMVEKATAGFLAILFAGLLVTIGALIMKGHTP